MCHGMAIPLLGFTVVNPVGIPLDRPRSTIVVLILNIYIYMYTMYIYIYVYMYIYIYVYIYIYIYIYMYTYIYTQLLSTQHPLDNFFQHVLRLPRTAEDSRIQSLDGSTCRWVECVRRSLDWRCRGAGQVGLWKKLEAPNSDSEMGKMRF